MNIQSLSTPERILLAEQLWDSVYSESSDIKLTQSQVELIDKRLSALESDGDAGDTWANVKNRIIKN